MSIASVKTGSTKHLSGFSLIELLIVITIMGLITSIVMPQSFNMIEQHESLVEQRKLVDFSAETL